MKTGRPTASKTMPGKVSPKMGKPMAMPGGAGAMGGGMGPGMGGFSKGGRVSSQNSKPNPKIQPAGTRKGPTIESKSKVAKIDKMGMAKGGKVKKKK